jgi:hypothetical protein
MNRRFTGFPAGQVVKIFPSFLVMRLRQFQMGAAGLLAAMAKVLAMYPALIQQARDRRPSCDRSAHRADQPESPLLSLDKTADKEVCAQHQQQVAMLH